MLGRTERHSGKDYKHEFKQYVLYFSENQSGQELGLISIEVFYSILESVLRSSEGYEV